MKTVQLIVNNDNLDDRKNEVDEGQYWPLVGLTLGSFLQVIAMDQQTCLLEICHSDGGRGRFFFIKGSLYDAQCGDLEGERAAMELVSWEGVRFIVKSIPEDCEIPRRINRSIISLLMESTRLRDEFNKDSSEEPNEVEDLQKKGETGAAGLSGKDRPEQPAPDLSSDFQQCVYKLKMAMGDALTRSAIFDWDSGEVIAGYNIKLSALDYYVEMIGIFDKVLKGQPSGPGQYFFTNITAHQILVFMLVKQIRWAIEFDSRQMKLGLFLNSLLPKLAASCEGVLEASPGRDGNLK